MTTLRLCIEHRGTRTELTLEPGERLRLGRGEPDDEDDGLQVHRVQGPLTSRRHAILGIDAPDGPAWVEDLGSRNGTLVDDAPIEAHTRVPIGPGQRLEIGDALVEVLAAPAPSASHSVLGTSPWSGEDASGSAAVQPPTQTGGRVGSQANPPPPQTGGDVAEGDRGGGRTALALRAQLDETPDARLTAWLERDGALSLIAGHDAALVLGRGHDVDVHVDDTTASRHHCRIGEALERSARSPFVLEDLDSRGGTWLNGQRVVSTLPLTHGDVVGLGRHQARVVIDGHGDEARLSLVLRRERALPGLGSDPHDTGRALHASGPSASASAHRRAPSWQPTSDLARPRRWPIALGLSAAIVALGLLLDLAAPGAGIPTRGGAGRVGPLSTPHVSAGLECSSCHAPSDVSADVAAPERQAACNGCHGPRTSMRPGHQKAAEAGALACADCHQIHRRMEGLTFTGAGGYRWWRTGADDVTGTTTSFSLPPGLPDQTVALVPLTACARCHDAGEATDPIHRCIDRSLASPGQLAEVHAGTRLADDEALDGALAMCFDEHQSHGLPQSALGAQHHVARPAIWEGARVLVAESFAQRPQPRQTSDWSALWWVLAAMIVPLGWAGVQSWRRAMPVTADAPDAAPASAPVVGKRMVPRIDPLTCVGCSACVDACPYDVLVLEQYVARAVRAEMCCGIGSCEEKCPNGSLTLAVEEADASSAESPPLRLTLESEHRRGVYVAGDLTGLPLIKNAINQGAAAISAVLDDLTGEGPAAGADVDVVVVGAGPAGLSAALACAGKGLSYRLIDQGEVAESIRSFPRGKLVFDQPMNLPVIGDLWLRESTKEALLDEWLRVIGERGIEVSTYTRLESLSEVSTSPLVFEVATSDPRTGAPRPSFRARRVVLCVGRRGSPRKLDVEVPDAAETRVHYSLADAQSFAGRRCLVVGMGDVAMETAVALANQPGTRVTMSYRRAGYHSGARRNQRAVEELVQAGLIEIHWSTEIEGIEPRRALLRSTDGEDARAVAFDAMFVMIGGVPPRALLDALGLMAHNSAAR